MRDESEQAYACSDPAGCGAQGIVAYGGEGEIRTLERLPVTHFPGVRLRPLGHLTVTARIIPQVSGVTSDPASGLPLLASEALRNHINYLLKYYLSIGYRVFVRNYPASYKDN